MGESRDFMTLEWVEEDIARTLQQAQESLEAFVADSADQSQLQGCYDAVHLVHGSLQMAGIGGGLLLTEQVEALLQALLAGKVEPTEEAFTALAQAIVNLPPYLAHAKRDGGESPILLLPAVNDIRRLLGEKLLPEATLFKPDLGAPRPPAGEALKADFDDSVIADVRKLRQIFQFSLIGLIRNEDIKVNLGRISNVLARLQQPCKGAPVNQLWEVAAALMEGMIGGHIEQSPSIVEMLRSVEKQIKALIQSGVEGLDSQPAPELLQGMLYHIATCSVSTPRVQSIRQEYRLENYQLTVGESQGLSMVAGPDRETLISVVNALSEELLRIKDTIDLYVRNEVKDNIDLGGLQPSLSQIASTLVMLNLEAPRMVVQEQLDTLLKHSGENSSIPAEGLLQIAEALLYVEAELETLVQSVSGADQDSVSTHASAASETVIVECLKNLKQAKEHIQEYSETDGIFTHLEAVPLALRAVYGGLSIMSLSTAGQLVFACSQFVEDDILALSKVPEPGAMQHLAEVLTTVEYYLESQAPAKLTDETVLEPAKEVIAALGYPIQQASGITSEDEDAVDTFYFDTDADELEEVGLDSSGQQDQEEDTAQTESAEIINFEPPATQDVPDSGETAVEDIQENLEAEPVVSEGTEPDPVGVEEEAGQVAGEEEEVDEEILEIFHEEAEEVFAVIDEFWPVYAQDFGNRDAMLEVRRGFHTLKGSGRMVGASVIAELAWSVENMLNQVIEQTVPMHGGIVTLVDEVRAQLPALLQHLKAGTEPDFEVAPLSARAEAYAAGQADMEPVEEASAEPVESRPEQPPEQAEPVATEDAAQDQQAVPETGLQEIFVYEAGQHLQIIDGYIERAVNTPDSQFSEDVYRAFHTLKGSANMASMTGIALLASAGETFVWEMRGRNLVADGEAVALLTGISGSLKNIIERIAAGEPEAAPEESLITGIHSLLEARIAEYDREIGPGTAEDPQSGSGNALQRFLQDNFEKVCAANEGFARWRENPEQEQALLREISESLTELTRASEQLDFVPLFRLLTALEKTYQAITEGQSADDASLQAMQDAHEGLLTYMDQIAAGQDVLEAQEWAGELECCLERMSTASDAQEQVVDAEPLPEEVVPEEAADVVMDQPFAEEADTADSAAPQVEPDEEIDPELIGVFLEEAEEISEAIAGAKQSWMDNVSNLEAVDQLQRSLHTLKGGARMAGLTAIGDLSHELESLYEHIVAGSVSPSPALFSLLHESDDRLAEMVLELKTQGRVSPADELVEKLRLFHSRRLSGEAGAEQADNAAAGTLVFDTALGATVEANAGAVNAFFDQAQPLLETFGALVKKVSTKGSKPADIVAELSKTVSQFSEQAFQAGVNETGNLGQIFIEVLGNPDLQALSKKELKSELADWFERIQLNYEEARKSALDGNAGGSADVQQEVAPTERVADRAGSADSIRVSSELLENLVNLAGETSVSRARIEQQVSNFGYAIEEVGSTIERLREQLRRLETETEAQILFRQEREGPTHEGFDPLEMDRYSRMQELSRSLVESVSDLLDLKDTLGDRARYAQNLLLEQSRVNTDLQEGLMKTRMVPFSRTAPKLRRLVRQVASELGKQVEFKLKNADAELDRSLLEHMGAPLEHMLRNAIDHGIELPEERVKAGKSEVGTVALKVSRDGGDILIELQDDGAGINIESVRNKAIENGLMTAEAELGDQEVLQFILHAGFSTAEQVTQISGRGVGMDVVSSEIKQLGGSIQINSEPGKGTQFLVRVPFTVSINRALMVHIGDESYALPLGTIDGVVRVSPYELEEYYKPDGPAFEYAGQAYDLHYLGEFMGADKSFQLQNQTLPLPVILIRTAEHCTAIQVDSISGSREIVVKPLGPQLGSLPGMSGATILGDGRVVLILDMPAVIRSAMAKQGVDTDIASPAEQSAQSDRLRVMVVDDSVTVRKVASRLLERNGMEVILAKDGVEAMTKLQDTVPDIVLLDIEMPRMDGFELASLVRHDERLKQVPLVMISSRTGQKHRDRAQELGVNQFMGKPFQEADLLDAISDLTDFERDSVE